ncbi:MAG: hypothetical protein ACOY3P_22005 [Planctomycetota bacterium]
MDSTDPRLLLLCELETRHDELLRQLEELDQELEAVLKRCSAARGLPGDPPESRAA